MALELIMNANGTIDHAPGAPTSGGVFTIIGTLSPNCRAEGAQVYTDPFTFTLSGADASGFDPGSVATTSPQTIPATAVKVKADGQLVMRDGDIGFITVTGTVSGTPVPFGTSVIVDDAGQTTSKAQ